MTQSSISIDTTIELLAICEKFEIPMPLPDEFSVEYLAEMITVWLRDHGTSVEDTDHWVLHEKIESAALVVLSNPENQFPREFANSQTIPLRRARMRFRRLLAKKTGMTIAIGNIPHAAYFSLAFVFLALPILRFSFYGYLVACIISLVLAAFSWSHFMSKQCTVSEMADHVVSRNMGDSPTLSRGDIVRYLNRKFPSGIVGIDTTQVNT